MVRFDQVSVVQDTYLQRLDSRLTNFDLSGLSHCESEERQFQSRRQLSRVAPCRVQVYYQPCGQSPAARSPLDKV